MLSACQWLWSFLSFSFLVIDGWGISSQFALRWMSLDWIDNKSTLVQAMAWCHQLASHYPGQSWPRSILLYFRPEWVKTQTKAFCLSMTLELFVSPNVALTLNSQTFLKMTQFYKLLKHITQGRMARYFQKFCFFCHWSSFQGLNRPISQIPKYTKQISHDAPFCNRNVHTYAHFCCKMTHCGIWDWCIVGVLQQVYC